MWGVREPQRLQVSNLSAFFLLTLVPLLPIVAFLSFLQRDQLPLERIAGAVYMAFLVCKGLTAAGSCRATEA
jgi:hypothetical protein